MRAGAVAQGRPLTLCARPWVCLITRETNQKRGWVGGLVFGETLGSTYPPQKMGVVMGLCWQKCCQLQPDRRGTGQNEGSLLTFWGPAGQDVINTSSTQMEMKDRQLDTGGKVLFAVNMTKNGSFVFCVFWKVKHGLKIVLRSARCRVTRSPVAHVWKWGLCPPQLDKAGLSPWLQQLCYLPDLWDPNRFWGCRVTLLIQWVQMMELVLLGPGYRASAQRGLFGKLNPFMPSASLLKGDITVKHNKHFLFKLFFFLECF